jgi:hypothetical protein
MAIESAIAWYWFHRPNRHSRRMGGGSIDRFDRSSFRILIIMMQNPNFIKIKDTIYNLNQIVCFWQFKRSDGIAIGISFAGHPEGDVVINYPDSEGIWEALNLTLNPQTLGV